MAVDDTYGGGSGGRGGDEEETPKGIFPNDETSSVVRITMGTAARKAVNWLRSCALDDTTLATLARTLHDRRTVGGAVVTEGLHGIPE